MVGRLRGVVAPIHRAMPRRRPRSAWAMPSARYRQAATSSRRSKHRIAPGSKSVDVVAGVDAEQVGDRPVRPQGHRAALPGDLPHLGVVDRQAVVAVDVEALASPRVGAMMPMRCGTGPLRQGGPRAWSFIMCVTAAVLPDPRPPRSSHPYQCSSSEGGTWWGSGFHGSGGGASCCSISAKSTANSGGDMPASTSSSSVSVSSSSQRRSDDSVTVMPGKRSPLRRRAAGLPAEGHLEAGGAQLLQPGTSESRRL